MKNLSSSIYQKKKHTSGERCSQTYRKPRCTLVWGFCHLFVLNGKRYCSLPQRTTLMVKFHWGNRGELFSRRGVRQNGEFEEF